MGIADGRCRGRRKIDLVLILVVELDQFTYLLGILRGQIGCFADIRRHVEKAPRFVGRNAIVDAFQRFEVGDFADFPDTLLIFEEQCLIGASPQLEDLGPLWVGHGRFTRQQTAQASAVDRADARAVVIDAGTGIPVRRNTDTGRMGHASKIQNRCWNVDTADY